MKNSFTFFKSFYEAINCLGEKSQLKLYQSIMKMQFNCCENVTELEQLCNEIETNLKHFRPAFVQFLLIKPHLLKSAKASINGSLGGAPEGNINAKKTSEKQANIKDKSININFKEKEIKKEKEKEILKNFNEFYLTYPNKKGKTKALEAYKKAILAGEKVCAFSKPSIIGTNALETSHTAIMDGLKKYIDDIRIKRTEPKFIKHPATWLNQKCWEDEYDSYIDYSDPKYHNSRL